MNNSLSQYQKIDRHAPLPILSLVFFLLASLPLAFLLISSNYAVDSQVRIIIIVYALTIILLGAIIGSTLQTTRRVALLTFVAGQTFWFAMPALGKVIGPDWFGERANFYITDQALVLTCIYLSGFAVVSLVAYWFFSLRFKSLFPVRPDSEAMLSNFNDKHMLWFVIVLAIFGLLPFIVYGGDLKTIVSGILGSRSAERGWAHRSFSASNPLYVIGRASFVTAGQLALVYAAKTQGIKNRLPWAIVFLLAFIITYFDSGTRSWTLLIVGPPAIMFLRHILANRTFRRWVVVAPLALVGVLWLAQIQRQFRTTGVSTETFTNASAVEVNDNDFFTETAIAVTLVPDRMDYLGESTLVLFLTNPIPRGIWPDKPYPRVIQMYSIGRSGRDEYVESGISRLPSMVGQHYMSWGILGICEVAIFYGLGVAWCDFLLRRKVVSTLTQILAATTTVWLFVGFRGFFPGFHYPIVILTILVLYERYGLTRRTVTTFAHPSVRTHAT